jgi:hypothetical protein
MMKLRQGFLQFICFYSLRQIFRSRALSKAVKMKIYKTIVKPAVVSGSETTEIYVKGLSTRERKILRRIYGLV